MGWRRRSTQNSQTQSSVSLCIQRALRWSSCLACLAVALLVSADAQPSLRLATNIATLLAYPSFYHMRPILLVGTVAQQPNGDFRVSDATGSLRIIPEGRAPDGVNEVRGVLWDIGRLKSDDPRLASYDLRATFGIDPEGGWPRPGDVMAVMASAIAPAAALSESSGTALSPGVPSVPIRSIVLDASRYVDQQVTITGQYSGRNLIGDLPDAPGQTRYDFVLRSADASIWVTNLPPRGKDARGRNFEFELDARLDTAKWLRVSGIVRQRRGLLWVEGQAGSLALAEAPTSGVAAEEAPVRVPAAPPPEVIFSTPTEDEIDVSTTTNVRIQFSRDIDPATFKGRIRATYLDSPGALSWPPGVATIQPGDFTLNYRGFNRVLELKFVKPLERFRTLKLELLPGILGTDQQELKPWTLLFSLGES